VPPPTGRDLGDAAQLIDPASQATEEYVAALVDAASPLSVAHRDKLAVILRGRAAATDVAYADAYAGMRQRAG
jgi:hypothetical protein